jgi:hypothetical protein
LELRAAVKVLLRARSKELAISYQFVKNPMERLKPRGFLLDGEDYRNVSSLIDRFTKTQCG